MPVAVTVIGSANMDLIFRVARMPEPGETLAGREFLTAHGGKGANQAVAAARLGARVRFLGAVGADPHGQALLDGLRGEGIDTSRVAVVPEASGAALILVADDGTNSIVVALGANGVPGPEYVVENAEAIEPGGILLLQLEMRMETVDEAIRAGRERGALVVLDAAPAGERYPDRLGQVDILSPNETEAASLLGSGPIGDLPTAAGAVRAMLDLGPRIVALKLGARGVMVGGMGEITHVPPFAIAAVDTTACGDAWTAGFAVALAEGLAPPDAARFGNACGALAATALGAQPSLPHREAVERLLGN